ncbi:hypothetical protein GCM10011516_09960 [Sphingobacterium cellulitidis]|uniref:Uncharacterized protein n=1 Tax=Sphingobacterium cellulitidis TaxID=1768011 RepID=A0A8H9KTL2_9SPHI|nr:hypothetical protein GCM10011516_09960 [Sphingobacterium soli]
MPTQQSLKINNLSIIGIGIEGKLILSKLILDYGIKNVGYIDFSMDKQLADYFIPFPGKKEFLYAEKQELYQVDNFNEPKFLDLLSQVKEDAVFVLCLSEPISHTVLKYILDTDYQILIRIPFKFENTNNFQITRSLLQKLNSRPKTTILFSDHFSEKLSSIRFSGIMHQLISGQANLLASKLGYDSIRPKIIRKPLSAFLQEKVNIIYDPNSFTFPINKLKNKIDNFISNMCSDDLWIVSLKHFAYMKTYYQFMDQESLLNLLALLIIVSFLKGHDKQMFNILFWGREAYSFSEILQESHSKDIPVQLRSISEGFDYLDKMLSVDHKLFLKNKLDLLFNDYILEFEAYYFVTEFFDSLQINGG